MRLTPDQVQAIRLVAQRELGDDARVRVFGSQALDDRRGGDIDLLSNGQPHRGFVVTLVGDALERPQLAS
ncbi:hypothetical protein C5F52_17555 [Limnohabitans sp. TS-CS-82]|uniref:hypothetical protein n=1 Tax=Limnohabitans sp. TS-CS-82 TaxID=2094193 RepID=UPI000CF1CC53|nr:hypothetical protein [Limnohabitans sp. TS-CS-82]PQA81825.1 hypothetical protein C5F52_17555 [Limnohabitans sp. TS-CS-82]